MGDGKDKREKYSFKVEDPYRQGKDEFNEYLISLRLPAGRYMLRELFGTARVFPIRGTFGAPVFMPFELSPGGIVYLGRIDATIRARRGDDELRAGPLVPLIDQAVSGPRSTRPSPGSRWSGRSCSPGADRPRNG